MGDVVPTVTIKTYPNQKPWIDGGIRAKLKVRPTAFNHDMVTGIMAKYKQYSYSLRKASKRNVSTERLESQFNGSDTRRMWQGLETITEYKKKTSHITDNVLLPDKLNTFFARFEDSATDVARYQGLWALLHCSRRKTFKRVNPHKAAGPDVIPSRVLGVCADQLAGVFTDIFNRSLSQSAVPTCFKMATIVPVPKEAKMHN
ncbi:uncharacterized protein LOC135560204 [Oncorhynchus nerka]|uniref:uncharacterized protein LOC135560204 n=1 Tax=Oncorhynchus nerka TaxID=8023 RepID=UPI0031B8AFCA